MARNGAIFKSPIIPTWKLVRFLASSTAPSSVTDTFARFTPAFKIAEEFCARETRTNNIKIAEHRMIFFSFIIVQFLNRKIFKEFASFNNSLQNTSQLNRQGVVMTSNRGKGLK